MTRQGGGYNTMDGKDLVMEYLRNNGDTNMGVDGSGTPIIFRYSPPPGKRFSACELSINLVSATKFENEKFAHLNALANGVSIRQNGVEIISWKRNRDITVSMPQWTNVPGGSENKDYSISGMWHLGTGANCSGIEIFQGNGFEFVIQDNLLVLGLTFYAFIKGRLTG